MTNVRTPRTTSDTSPWTEHPSWNVSRAKQRWRILKCHDNNPSRPRNGSISDVYHPCFRPTELHQREMGVSDSHPKTTHRVNPRVPSCICWWMFLKFYEHGTIDDGVLTFSEDALIVLCRKETVPKPKRMDPSRLSVSKDTSWTRESVLRVRYLCWCWCFVVIKYCLTLLRTKIKTRRITEGR